MAIINYLFADGHREEIECTEKFKKEYEFLETREKARYWKIKKQKQRAHIPVKYDLSLELLCEYGEEHDMKDNNQFQLPFYEITSNFERPEEPGEKFPLFRGLTDKQRIVAEKYYLKGKSKAQIAREENVSEGAVRHILSRVQNIFKLFL